LRLLDEYWDLAVWFSSMFLILFAGLVCALVALVFPVGILVLAGLILVLLAVVLATVMMTAGVLHGAWWLYTALEPRHWRRHGSAVEQHAVTHWNVVLCHITEPSNTDSVLREVLRKVAALSASARGARHADPNPDLVLMYEKAITTVRTAQAVTQATLVTALPEGGRLGGVLLLHQPGARATPDKSLLPATGVTLLFTAVALLIVLSAPILAQMERAACAPTSCEGRPADYGNTLRWLLQRLLWSDPDGLSPATWPVWWFGWSVSLLTPVLASCLVIAVRQYWKHCKQERERSDETLAKAMATTDMMVLVAADVERKAVIASLQAATGLSGPAPREARGRQTVFDLSVVNGTHVLLAQSEQGIEGPTAMMLTASEVIRERKPDFVVQVGLCYGLQGEPKQHIGDIVIASQLQNLNWKKVQTRDGIEKWWPRSGRVDPSPTLLDRFRAATQDWNGAEVRHGLMLSEGALVDSAEHRAGLQQQFPDALVSEMDATGVYAASHREGVDWIVVKAISDWGDGTKNKMRQSEAARNVADFLVHVLQGRGLGHPPSRVTGRG
ncbi:MAG: hypothetical protein ACRDS1_05335, partial [Pseudonocardiaceae bacterium]